MIEWLDELVLGVLVALLAAGFAGIASRVANLAGRVAALEHMADYGERIARLEEASRDRDH